MTEQPAAHGTDATAGLRERKRAATRRRIIVAARQGCLDDGLEHLTIDAIARAADVSPRSFFNYFPSKEAAIVGTRSGEQQPMGDADLDRLPADVASAVVTVVLAVLSQRLDDPYDDLLREVLRRFPQLLDMSRSQWKDAVHTATAIVERLLQRRYPTRDDAPVLATTLVAMCVATIRAELPNARIQRVDDTVRVLEITASMRATASVVLHPARIQDEQQH